MKNILSSIILVLALFYFNPIKAQIIPAFELNDPKGNSLNFEDLKGEKLTIIDFWATWCKPCLNAIPRLIELSEKYQDKGVKFIGISVDGPRSIAKVLPMVETLKIPYPILLDQDMNIANQLSIAAFPTLLIVGTNNKILKFHEGFSSGEEVEIEKEILKYLK
ncbi:MAG: hypothetical protein RIR51_1565 [Bacteroidota bacterium]|jgi:thiol-disulfide isomerase/thioredoxin